MEGGKGIGVTWELKPRREEEGKNPSPTPVQKKSVAEETEGMEGGPRTSLVSFLGRLL